MKVSGKLSLILLAPAIFIIGCSSTQEPEPEIAEIVSKDSSLTYSVDTPEKVLVNKAKKFYEAELYFEAREAFELLRDGYPFGAYAEFAELKIADCYFHSGDYLTAASLYEDFIKQRPSSPSLPYALMNAGRAYQLSNTATGRDPAPLHKGLVLYDRFLKEFPDSIYSAAVTKMRAELVTEIIAYELMIRDYYAKKNNQKAAEARVASLKETMGDSHELKIALGESAPIAPTVILAAERQNVESSEPTLASIKRDSTYAMASPKLDKLSSQDSPAAKASTRILKIDCRSSQDQIFVSLSKEIPSQIAKSLPPSQASVAGKIRIAIPQATADSATMNCFSSGDLKVDGAGTITLNSDKAADLMLLHNPTRLLISLQ